MRPLQLVVYASLLLIWFLTTDKARAAEFYRRGRPLPVGGSGPVVLPFPAVDATGRLWRIREAGSYDLEGNSPPIEHGAILFVNGGHTINQNNRGQLDPMTGELVLDNIQVGSFAVTRRVLLDLEQGLTRYIDIIRNDSGTPQSVTLSIHSNLTFPVESGQFVADPADKTRNIGWVGKSPGGAFVQLFSVSGGRTTPKLDWNQGGNFFTITASLTIPAKSERAVLHVHHLIRRVEDGVRFINEAKATSLLKNTPPALRQIVMNFPDLHDWVGDVALLRGSRLLDVIELQNGDRLQGNLKESSFALDTLFGTLELPAANVLGLINTGPLHQRQLLVTADGQIFGGRLKKRSLEMILPNGQATNVPVTQISRAGYRLRDEKDERSRLERPMLLLHSGERLFVRSLPKPISVTARFGTLSLSPEMLAAVFLDGSAGADLPRILLSDGSMFSGLLDETELEIKLETLEKPVRLPFSAIARLRLAKTSPQPADRAPLVHLRGGDVLTGRLAETLKVETAFEERTIPTDDIRLLARENGQQPDVRILLTKGDSVSGGLRQAELPVQMECGLKLRVPTYLLAEYSRPPVEPGNPTK